MIVLWDLSYTVSCQQRKPISPLSYSSKKKQSVAHRRVSECNPVSRAISHQSDFYLSDGPIFTMTYLINVVKYTLCVSRARDPLTFTLSLGGTVFTLGRTYRVWCGFSLYSRVRTDRENRRKSRKGWRESQWVSVTPDTASRAPREALSVTVT